MAPGYHGNVCGYVVLVVLQAGIAYRSWRRGDYKWFGFFVACAATNLTKLGGL